MNSLIVTGHVDEHHVLSAKVPDSIPPGPVKLSILPVSQEDEAGDAWMAGIAEEWADDLDDSGQDIYTLADGEAARKC